MRAQFRLSDLIPSELVVEAMWEEAEAVLVKAYAAASGGLCLSVACRLLAFTAVIRGRLPIYPVAGDGSHSMSPHDALSAPFRIADKRFLRSVSAMNYCARPLAGPRDWIASCIISDLHSAAAQPHD